MIIHLFKSVKMKKFIIGCFIAFLVAETGLSQENGNFSSLFNGKDLTNWSLQKPGGFEVNDGEMVTRSYGNGNDLFTTRSYGNFIFSCDFLLSEVGNSGIYIRCEPFNPGAGFEVQLLAPWTPWRDDLHCTGSMYGHVAVKNRPDETTGIWYKMEIKCDRNIITISVNDKVVTQANTDTVKTMAGKPFTGVIGLQANHGTKDQFARFRNLRIRDLDTEPEYVITGFYDKNDQLRNLSAVSAVSLGAKMILPLASVMSAENIVAKNGAKQALFDLVAKASDPAASKKEKKEVAVALKDGIDLTSSEITKKYLSWLLGMIAQ